VVNTTVWLRTSRTSPCASQLPPTEVSPNLSHLKYENISWSMLGARLLTSNICWGQAAYLKYMLGARLLTSNTYIHGGPGCLPWAIPHPTSPPFWYVPFDPSGGACSPT
jgi:hypothetical protein